MAPRTITPPPLNNKSSPGASSTGYVLPSPSLQSEEGFRQRNGTSPRSNIFSEKNTVTVPPSPRSPQSPQSPVNIKPYIGLKSKLSLSWVNYTVVALIFIILRLFTAMKSIEPTVEQVKEKAVSACDALELATSTVTSLPHFMAGGFNRATVESVMFTIKGVARTIDLIIVAAEGIIIWLIHVFHSTYRCILEFALKGSFKVMIESIKVLVDSTNGQLNNIKTQLDGQISGANTALDELRKAINDASGVIGVDIKVPTLAISTDALAGIQFPTTSVDGLDTIGSIPSMQQMEDNLSSLISIPFNELRGIVQTSMSNVKFNQSVLPVPPMNEVKFCADNLDLSVIDDISRDLVKAAYIGMGIIFAVILLMIAINALVIWFSHKRWKRHINRTTTTIKLVTIKANKESVIEVIKIAEHPYISRWIIKGSNLFKNSENKNLFRWFWDYILHKPALICLIIGLAGVFGIYLQLAVLDAVKQNYKQPIADSISNFSNAVNNLVNSQLNSTSVKFASDSNNIISSFENDINQELFGWVNTTTTTLNNTLNTAVDEVSNFVKNTFGGVPILLTIVEELVNCLFVVKVEGIQAGLTFIKDNAFIGLPRVNDNVLLIGEDNMDEVVGQVTNRLVGSPPSESGNGEIGGEIGRIFDVYERNLRNELPLFYTLIAIWFFVIFMGLIRVLWFIFQRRKRNKLIQNDSIKRNSNSSSISDQQNDLSKSTKSIKDDDDHQFDDFRSKMIEMKNNRSSPKNMINPTFPRNYYPSQPNDNYYREYDGERQRPNKPPKPFTLERQDVRDPNHLEHDNYEYI
jgi:Na+-transporting methylmalonyl-CoA/oxaloacetate decarboxylase gamma subunit